MSLFKTRMHWKLERHTAASLNLLNIHQETKVKITDAQAEYKKYFDANHQPPAYKIGDLVLVSNARRAQRKGDKLAPFWRRPHVITEIRCKGTFHLEGCKTLVNAMLNKPYHAQ